MVTAVLSMCALEALMRCGTVYVPINPQRSSEAVPGM